MHITAGLLLAAAVLSSLTAIGDHTVGNPGDPIRLVMREARDEARILLIRVHPDKLDTDDADLKEFYRKHYKDLDLALMGFTAKWIPSHRPHCAEAFAHNQTIVFSYPRCSVAVVSKALAVKLLLHEAVHLVGEPDEHMADAVATVVFNTWQKLSAAARNRWQSLGTTQSPLERAEHVSVQFQDHEGSKKVFVWGGCNDDAQVALHCSTFLGDGGIYDLETMTWESVPAPPGGLEHHLAYAKGIHYQPAKDHPGHILIWGGCSGSKYLCDTDNPAILDYDLQAKTWTAKANPDHPTPRTGHHTVWTGSRMLVWGGIADRTGPGRGLSLGAGAAFDPSAQTWEPLPEGLTARRFSSAVWTQDGRWIIFGGCERQQGIYCPKYLADGGIYNPKDGSWTYFQSPGLFRGRAKHSAVWTGDRMLVWGGLGKSGTLSDGAVFDPKTLEWQVLPGWGVTGRYDHSAVWTGDRVLIWGGVQRYQEFASGVVEFLLPSPNHPNGLWNMPQQAISPVARRSGTSFWTGSHLFVWGGTSQDRSYLNSGGLFWPNSQP